MSSTSIIALTTLLVAGPSVADESMPRASATVVARAQIVSGVRTPDADSLNKPQQKPSRQIEPKARERPCPEKTPVDCTLVVLDMP